MEVKNFIGMDISKQTVDVAVIVDGKKDDLYYRHFKKSNEALEEMKAWLLSLNVTLNCETVCCMEYTGLYNSRITDFLMKQKEVIIWIEMPLHIKNSLGLTRGKTDKIDAKRIALFALKNREEIKQWSPIDEEILIIKNLLIQRDRLIESKKKLQVPLEELKQEGLVKQANSAIKLQKPAIDGIVRSIDKLEATIKKIMSKNENLSNIHKQLCSIVGIGEIVSWHFIAYTNAFNRLSEGKQLACYCGVVPFAHDSGTTIKKKPRVSHMANKKLKTLLHLSAMSAISFDSELKAYYERKVSEGKNKMSVINSVRNKLVLRITAVVRDKRHYVRRNVNNAA